MSTNTYMGLHVAVVGNPIDGIEIFGPFATGCEALDWLASCELDGWIVPLKEPVAEDEKPSHCPFCGGTNTVKDLVT